MGHSPARTAAHLLVPAHVPVPHTAPKLQGPVQEEHDTSHGTAEDTVWVLLSLIQSTAWTRRSGERGRTHWQTTRCNGVSAHAMINM